MAPELGIAHGSRIRDCPYLVPAISTYPYLVPYSTVRYYTGHQYLPLPSTGWGVGWFGWGLEGGLVAV